MSRRDTDATCATRISDRLRECITWLMIFALPFIALSNLAMLPAARAADGAATSKEAPPSLLYHNYCSVCHGDRGDAQSRARGSLNPAPRDFTTATSASELSRERMLTSVTHGVPGTAMVAWSSQLSEAQIAGVVDYIRENFMRASTGNAGNAAGDSAGRGRRLYARSCSVCHGDRGSGSMWASANLRPAPRDFSAPQARAELSRERMLASVAAGRPGTAMAGFATQLSKDDIEAVVDYIRSAFMREGSEAGISGTMAHGKLPGGTAVVPNLSAHAALPAAPQGMAPSQPPAPTAVAVRADSALPMPGGLKGDAKAGQRFYDANCATCHGRKGDGQGPRAYFINPKPRNFIAEPWHSSSNRVTIYAAVSAGRQGTEMPAWDKVLSAQQIADVSEYVFRAFVQGRGDGAR